MNSDIDPVVFLNKKMRETAAEEVSDDNFIDKHVVLLIHSLFNINFYG